MMERAALVALCRPAAEVGRIEVRSPGVGLWRGHPPMGAVIRPGETLGALEILGALHPLRAPIQAVGQVVARPASSLARVAVEYGQVLLVLDPRAGHLPTGAVEEATAAVTEGGRFFLAPMSGRYYARPAPDKPPFVVVGQVLKAGDTVGLLEVMKTFNRITYGGGDVPDKGRVKRVIPADGDDINAGDPILEMDGD